MQISVVVTAAFVRQDKDVIKQTHTFYKYFAQNLVERNSSSLDKLFSGGVLAIRFRIAR